MNKVKLGVCVRESTVQEPCTQESSVFLLAEKDMRLESNEVETEI